MNIKEIKARLEANKSFQYWQEEYGIGFDDFRIVDVQNGRELKKGNQRIGNFCIFVDGNRIQAAYDLDIKDARQKRVQRIQKQKSKETAQ